MCRLARSEQASLGERRSPDMRIVTTAIATATMIGSCASARDTMVYETDVSEEQKREDEASCTLAALAGAAPDGVAHSRRLEPGRFGGTRRATH